MTCRSQRHGQWREEGQMSGQYQSHQKQQQQQRGARVPSNAPLCPSRSRERPWKHLCPSPRSSQRSACGTRSRPLSPAPSQSGRKQGVQTDTKYRGRERGDKRQTHTRLPGRSTLLPINIFCVSGLECWLIRSIQYRTSDATQQAGRHSRESMCGRAREQ